MNKQRKNPRVKLVSMRSKIALVCSLIVCVNFLTAYFTTFPIEKASCETVTTAFEYCKTVRGRFLLDRGLHIYCSNSKSYYVAEAYLGYGLKESIEELDKGEKLVLVVDNYDGEIVELSSEDKVLFSYSDYVQRVEKEKSGILYFFFFTLLLPIINIINIYREKNRFNKK